MRPNINRVLHRLSLGPCERHHPRFLQGYSVASSRASAISQHNDLARHFSTPWSILNGRYAQPQSRPLRSSDRKRHLIHSWASYKMHTPCCFPHLSLRSTPSHTTLHI